MKRSMTAMLLTASLALTACTGWTTDGAGLSDPVQQVKLPESVRAPCKKPWDHLDVTDWEIMAGRLGDDLLHCGAAKDISVDGFDALAEAVAKS